GHPVAELVLTVLSQSTNDRNRDVAFLRLRTRLPTWEQVRDAPLEEVEGAITADPRDPRHELSLDWLARVPLEQARDCLTALPGVGRKTAACVLLFSYGLRDIP